MTDGLGVHVREVPEQLHMASADVLGRQEFVDQLIRIVETLSVNKKNATYAINGEWGVGKTFVLEAFEEKLRQFGQLDSTLNKYLVFHYNCWQYDYYAEPLISIVSSLLDQIDEQVNLLPEDKREPIKIALKKIGIGALKAGGIIIENKLGINPNDILDISTGIKKEVRENLDEIHKYDSYFDFKKTLGDLSKTIKNLAADQTVIFVVDELDRCLPEYTIKILERLHHIFADLPNVQVVLAVDRSQLESTITNIYGEATSARKYLEKFIQFEIRLTTGNVKDIIGALYPQYYDCFKSNITSKQDITKVCQLILNGIEIRTAKAIVDKSFLCHRLLNSEEDPQDGCILVLEVFFTLLKQFGFNKNAAKLKFSAQKLFSAESFKTIPGSGIFTVETKPLTGLIQLGDYYRDQNKYNNYLSRDQYRASYARIIDVWGLLLASYRAFIGLEDMWIDTTYSTLSGEKCFKQYIMDYINKLWDFLQIIS